MYPRKILIKKNTKNTFHFIGILTVCLSILTSCGFGTFQYYIPMEMARTYNYDNKIIMKMSNHVELRSWIQCDAKTAGVIPLDFSNSPEYCKIYIYLAGPSSVQFDFINDDVILRDNEGSSRKYQRLNMTNYDGVSAMDKSFDVDEYQRGYAIGFLLSKPPKILEAVIPNINIEGTIHKIQILKFRYKQTIETIGIHKGL